MKKWIITTMLALAAACACPQPVSLGWMPACAAVAEASDFVIEGNVLTAYTGTDSVVTVPGGVDTIGEGAFAGNTTITEVELTYAMDIGKDAFAGCTSLVYVDNAYRQSIRTLGEGAFAGCARLNSLACFSIGLTEIGARAFAGCTGMKSLTLPDNITAIGEDAFEGCTPAIYCGAGSTTAQTLAAVGRTGAPLTAPGLTFAYYSNDGWTVTAFDGSVSDVVIPEGVKTINGSVFSGKAITSVTLPSSLRRIKSSAFKNCTGLTEITLPDGVTTMGSDVFYGCIGLRSVHLPQRLKSVASSAFQGCSNLTEVDIPSGVTSIGSFAFYGCKSLAQVTLPEGLETIDTHAFYSCEKLTSLVLPESLKTMDYDALYGTAIPSVVLPENMTDCREQGKTRLIVSRNTVTAQNMASKPNYVVCPFADPQWPELDVYYLIDEYTGEKSLQLYKYYEDGRTSYTVPDEITGIYQSAFQYNGKDATLTEIIVSDAVKTIGEVAFCNQNALRRLVLPDNLTAIGNYIADSSRELQVLCSRGSATARLITEDVYHYGFTDPAEPEYSWRYEGDDLVLTLYRGAAANVTVPGGVTAIWDRAFYENKTLETVTLPEGLKKIQSAAFQSCTKLREVTFPSTLESIGSFAFNGDHQLKHVVLPQSLTTLGAYSFPFDLETITLPDNVTTVDTYPFDDFCLILCRKDSVTARSVSAENAYYRLCDPADPDWLWRYEEDGSLSLCGYRGSASAITLPGWSTRVAASARWDGAKQLSSVVIPEGYTEVGDNAFDYTGIDSITLPTSLKTIGFHAFESVDLTMIQLPEGLETIGEDAFWDCDSLTSLTIPTTVTSIPHPIAPDCDELTTVVLPRELTTIADGAFGDALTTVYCYKGSVAEQWANDNGVPLIKYLDNTSLESRVRLTGPNTTYIENTVYEVGGAYAWRTGVTISVQPLGKTYTLTCESSNPEVARVDGEMVTFLAPGSATLTIAIAERPDVAAYRLPVQVYTPVRDFTVPEAVFVKKNAKYNDWPRIMPAQVEPQNANPWFSWRSNNGGGEWEDTRAADLPGVIIWPGDRLGMAKAEMQAYSGVKRPFLIVTYETIGEVYAYTQAYSLAVGEVLQPDITVVVDGVEMDNMPYLYTLKSSNTRVAAPTEDGKLLGVAPGTATITVTARESGKTARFTVTVANVARMTLPSALKTVKREAFAGAQAEEIILPDGCETIESRAFAYCMSLRSVTIPASVTSIASDAFEGCGDITVITPAGSAAAQTLGGLSGITVMEQ